MDIKNIKIFRNIYLLKNFLNKMGVRSIHFVVAGILSLGAGEGGTNFLLSQATPSASLMIGIDSYAKNSAKLKYFSRQSQQIIFVKGSSSVARAINKVKRLLNSRKLDLLFIDGDHSYKGVRGDFLNYRHFVREGGIIAFHDIVPDYFTRYAQKTQNYTGKAPRFYDSIKTFYPHYEFIKDPEQDGFGIGAIRYSKEIILPENL